MAALVDTAFVLGTTAASGLITTVLDHRFALHYSQLRARITLEHLFATHVLASAKAVGELTSLVTQQSYALAFADVALVLTAVALFSIPLVLLVKNEDLHNIA